jgi:hypothetical protein
VRPQGFGKDPPPPWIHFLQSSLHKELPRGFRRRKRPKEEGGFPESPGRLLDSLAGLRKA